MQCCDDLLGPFTAVWSAGDVHRVRDRPSKILSQPQTINLSGRDVPPMSQAKPGDIRRAGSVGFQTHELCNPGTRHAPNMDTICP